jgi:glycine cleavage system H lipoate-binding protein
VLREPSLINKDPYGSWILKIKGVVDADKLKNLEEARKLFEEESQRVVR